MAETDSRKTPRIPRHVAIVMDGNGRWAQKRLMPRTMGHKAGVEAVVRIVRACADRGVTHLTMFAFSSENWKRPEEEVSGLMSLMVFALAKYVTKLAAEGARIRVAGDLSVVSEQVRNALRDAEARTAHNSKLTMTVAFNYGGRWDVLQACKRAMADGLQPEALDESKLSSYMTMSYAPDPDLVIRTGGEMRLSNFLLWQSAYAELYFTDSLWPDFDEIEFDKALAVYAQRERRFGDVGESESADAGASAMDGKAAC